MESTSLESEIFKVTETDFERIKNENRKIERFGDSTENIHNEKNALEQIIIDKSKEMGAQFVINASTVDKVAADAMTNLVLGFGRELNLTAGFSQKMENDVTILVRLVVSKSWKTRPEFFSEILVFRGVTQPVFMENSSNFFAISLSGE